MCGASVGDKKHLLLLQIETIIFVSYGAAAANLWGVFDSSSSRSIWDQQLAKSSAMVCLIAWNIDKLNGEKEGGGILFVFLKGRALQLKLKMVVKPRKD